jgi:hypothetical protein
MPFPTVAVKVSYGTTRFATPSYSTVTARDVLSIETQVGKESDLDGSNPGTLSVRLNNSDREFDPNNAAGAHYPNLTPGKQTQVTATYDATAGQTAISYVGIGALASGSNVSLTPALPAGLQAADPVTGRSADLMLILASIRNSGTGTVNTPTGWTALLTSGNVALLGKYYETGDAAPTVTFAAGVVNATTLAQCMAFRGVDPDITRVLGASTSQLNASAQNIAVPGLVAPDDNYAHVLMAWKQDDWTGVGQLSGQFMTEISDSPSTTGDDAGLEIQYRLGGFVGAATFSATTLTVTGGAVAISRALVVALRPFRGTTYQIFNGYTASWPQQYGARTGTATLKATGPFGFLARTPIPDPYSAAVEATGPTAWYRLNEGSGMVLADSSGNGHHGRWVPELAEVKTSSGLVVGGDSAISLPAAPSVRAVGVIPPGAVTTLRPLSIEMWLKIDKIPVALTDPLDLGVQFLAMLLFRGGVNIRINTTTWTYPGAIEFLLADTDNVTTSSIAQAITAFDTGNGVWYYNVCDGRVHHVVCTMNTAGTVLCIFVDGVDRAPVNNFSGGTVDAVPARSEIDLNHACGWDGTAIVDELAFYDSELDSATINAHYQAGAFPGLDDTTGARAGRVLDLIGWPAGLRDLDGGQTVLGVAEVGGVKALDYLDRVAASEQGWLSEAHADSGKVRFQSRTGRLTDARSTVAQTLFSDQATDIASNSAVVYSAIALASDDRPAANVVTVKWRGGDVVTSDQSSVDAYGEIPTTVDTILESGAEAENLAEWVLVQQSALFTRIRSVTLRPSAMNGTAADRAWTAALARQEGDRVRVVHQPASTGATIDQQLYIIGIEHHVAAGVEEWETTFHLAPAITTAYWVLGASLLGTTTRLAY